MITIYYDKEAFYSGETTYRCANCTYRQCGVCRIRNRNSRSTKKSKMNDRKHLK